jgi:hypothetical protein
MASPTILASEAIEVNRCIRLTTSQSTGSKTISGSPIAGITSAAAVNGSAIKFQTGPIYTISVGGTITSGDYLIADVDGKIVASSIVGQYIAIENSISGKTVNARKVF